MAALLRAPDQWTAAVRGPEALVRNQRAPGAENHWLKRLTYDE